MKSTCFSYFFALFVGSILIGGCGSDDVPEVLINAEADFEILVEKSSTLVTHYYRSFNVRTNISNYTGSKDGITINPYSATMEGIFVKESYGFIRDISIYVISQNDPSKRKEIFYREEILPNEDETLELFPTLLDVTDILSEEIVDIEVRINLRSFVPQTFDNRIRFNYSIK